MKGAVPAVTNVQQRVVLCAHDLVSGLENTHWRSLQHCPGSRCKRGPASRPSTADSNPSAYSFTQEGCTGRLSLSPMEGHSRPLLGSSTKLNLVSKAGGSLGVWRTSQNEHLFAKGQDSSGEILLSPHNSSCSMFKSFMPHIEYTTLTHKNLSCFIKYIP